MARDASRKRAVDEAVQFRRLQNRLPRLWRSIREIPAFEHTSVVVPSLSVDQEELSKIEGASFYEERLLFVLMRLRHPGARVIYVTSQPVHPEIVDYYLQLLHGVPAGHARRRLTMLSVWDGSPRPLTEKVLERRLLLERLRGLLQPRSRAYLTCFNTTFRERRLAVALGIPLNGVDPDLLELGSKSGSRRVFETAGVSHPAGFENVSERRQVVEALSRIAEARPQVRRAIVKLDHSFSGEGNATYVYPSPLPAGRSERLRALDDGLAALQWSAPGERIEHYLPKLEQMGGIVEECLEANEFVSPSVQLRIHPDRRVQLVSTHDQILGGATGQIYLGCRFPADAAYRPAISEAGLRIAAVLRELGVIGRFGIDFVALRNPGGDWECHAIEINLRMGGTTTPYLALQFLTGGDLDAEGRFVTAAGRQKYYRATDHLKAAAYRGLMPEDLIEQTVHHGLGYDPSTQTGVLFHMIGALSRHGKLGLTCIGDSPQEAEAFFERTVRVLDFISGAQTRGHRHAPLLDRPGTDME